MNTTRDVIHNDEEGMDWLIARTASHLLPQHVTPFVLGLVEKISEKTTRKQVAMEVMVDLADTLDECILDTLVLEGSLTPEQATEGRTYG